MSEPTTPPREALPTDFGSKAAISFRTDLTKEQLMELFTEFLNRGLFTAVSGLLSARADVEASCFVSICTEAGDASREHPACIIAATGDRAAELLAFYENHKDAEGNPAPLPTNHKKLFIELPEPPKDPKILVP